VVAFSSFTCKYNDKLKRVRSSKKIKIKSRIKNLNRDDIQEKSVDDSENCESLLGLTAAQIREKLSGLGQPDYRAHQIYKWIHHHNVDSFDEMTNLSKSLRETLKSNFCIKTLELDRMEASADGTEKYLWRLWDNRKVESVLIPEERRNTLCISSQVGCSLGCRFCATGSMGLIRNLTAGEIVEQVLQVNRRSRHEITNVVFMGMGEPFLNYPGSIQAATILGDPEGVAIANRKITISTSGVVPKIRKFADEGHPFKLAVSLHAPTQELRHRLMPIAGKFSLEALMESILYYMRARRRNQVTFEYVLLNDINDSPLEARQLISLLSPIRCKLNVIPCNRNYLGFEPPPADRIDAFVDVLMKAPFPVTVRKNRGEDITAACGQLAVETQEKTIFMR
jgi:23S rRNA (adenine2503-C2)-methyltransferase